MKEGNVDQQIREKLLEREIQPSASAWERLSSQLDDVEQKKKRNWFLYVGYAASILLIVSLFFFLNKEEDASAIPENTIVLDKTEELQIDTNKDFKPIEFENEVIAESEENNPKDKTIQNKNTQEDVKTEIEQVVRKKPNLFKSPKDDTVIADNEKKIEPTINVQEKIKELTQKEETVITQNDSSATMIKKSGITVDSDALLMSVTSTKEELRAYYKKYKIDRKDVLIAIEKELKKSKLKVDPKTILAEVETDINEEDFQNNFYQFIKKRVSSVATAIANRNN